MNFGKIFERKKPDSNPKNLEEIYKIKGEIEREDRIFEGELSLKYALLQEFSLGELKELCQRLLGRDPPIEKYTELATGEEKTLPIYKEDYVQFIIDELRLDEVRDYALQNKIVSEDFFKKHK